MLNKKALAATAAAQKLYVEDVFSTYLYTGNGSTQTITNGIDLSGEGGLVWTKNRTDTSLGHFLWDTIRGNNNFNQSRYIQSNSTASQQEDGDFITSWGSTGYTLGSTNRVNDTNGPFVSWTFRQAEKFFDVVTYTGNGSLPNQLISHNLGSVPGCIIIKATSAARDWIVWHRGNGTTNYAGLSLNLTSASAGSVSSGDLPTSTQFKPAAFFDPNYNNANETGVTYVAYLFAHDAGGFGDSGSESVIKCGSYTAGTNDEVVLGWEPQWLMIKNVDSIPRYQGDWNIFDNMRGLPVGGSDRMLWANSTDSEYTGTANGIDITATGFKKLNWENSGSDKYIYIAIRRGPMKTPEAGTEVFNPIARTGSGTNPTNVSTSTNPDLLMSFPRTASPAAYGMCFWDKLRGVTQMLQSSNTNAETTTSATYTLKGWLNDGYQAGADFIDGYLNYSGSTYVNYPLTRAPGFFDVVCYTGDASTTARPHNLGVAPQLMIIKQRNDGAISWYVYAEPLGNNKYLILDSTNGQATASFWNNQTPTATNFYIRASGWPNEVGGNYVAYLFASAAGVSKVGSYTGNGSSQTINCGFTGGARFVLIKETTNASSGSWVVFDSARGIVSGNDPYLLLNSTAAEVTNKDAVDTDSTGFIVNETTGQNVNTNSSTYIFLAIA